MKRKKLRFGEGFRVMRGNRASQAAEIAGTLVFIQRREKHQGQARGRK